MYCKHQLIQKRCKDGRQHHYKGATKILSFFKTFSSIMYLKALYDFLWKSDKATRQQCSDIPLTRCSSLPHLCVTLHHQFTSNNFRVFQIKDQAIFRYYLTIVIIYTIPDILYHVSRIFTLIRNWFSFRYLFNNLPCHWNFCILFDQSL